MGLFTVLLKDLYAFQAGESVTLNLIENSCRAVPRSLLQNTGTILLESQLREPGNYISYLLSDPIDVISCVNPESVAESIGRIDKELNRGRYVAGFISYEAGFALNPHQAHRPMAGFPLIWMGVYDRAWITDAPVMIPGPHSTQPVIDPALDTSHDEFVGSVKEILRLIREGETYQVNLTCRMHLSYTGTPRDMYLRLRQSHPVPYGALINCGPFSLISQSPELFLKKSGDILESRPMKGTAPRGENIHVDRKNEENLRLSSKDRAENLMIGDLMRNDLGRLAVPGSVEVFDPFRIERYQSVYQMTTGVRCRIRQDLTVEQILAATFPPGSITGAPKIRTMQIIGLMEKNPRKAYTGAIGIFLPDGDFVLNVAIRTIIMNNDGNCEMGIGSGIVADSSPEAEYRETLLKSEFLKFREKEPVRLLETILLTDKEDLEYLSEHLGRMERSANALDYPFSYHHAQEALARYLGPTPAGPAIVRLRLNSRGDYQVETRAMDELDTASGIRITISHRRTHRSNELLKHKTTDRALYDEELEKARSEGCTEALFINNDGHITEGAFTNIFILTPDGWKTPPVTSGLLPGIWRAKFLQKTGAAEVVLEQDDLRTASKVVIGNSVRGAIEVDEIVDSEGQLVFSRKTG